MNDYLPKVRLYNWAGFFFCLISLAYAYYQQYEIGLEPCALCIFQRFAMMALALTFLFAALHHRWHPMHMLLQLLAGGAGIALAARHIWIQGLPADQVPECGPGIEYIIEKGGWGEAFLKAFKGTGDCASIDWTFVGLSMPMWVLIMFIGMAVLSIVFNGYLATRRRSFYS